MSANYAGCDMKTQSICARLLRVCLNDADLTFEALYAFTTYDAATLSYTSSGDDGAHGGGAAAAKAKAKVAVKDSPADKSQERRPRHKRGKRPLAPAAAEPTAEAPAAAGGGGGAALGGGGGGGDIALGGGGGDGGGGGGRGGRGGGAGRGRGGGGLHNDSAGARGDATKSLGGYCVFHLAGLCGIASNRDPSAKLNCYTQDGETCPNGLHALPPAAAAGPMAADLQQSLDGPTPMIALPAYVKRAMLTKLKALATGVALGAGPH
jgi:hypothetical protein